MKTKMPVPLDSTFLLKEILIFIMPSKEVASLSIFIFLATERPKL